MPSKAKKRYEPLNWDWEPVLRGHIYCAPACGRGCTKAAYERAQKKAAALAKRLGPRWKPRVWENLGWHYSAISPCGSIKVHSSYPEGEMWTAYFGPEATGGKWAESGKTPWEAIDAVVATGREYETEIRRLFSGIDQWIERERPKRPR
jgi:hypothetical protein